MPRNSYRVIQWATGHLGKVAIRHFSQNPAFELVGVLVTNPDKVGKDAGEIAGSGPTGVIATADVEAIIGMEADCVYYAPAQADLEVICRLLRSGKNLVMASSYFYPDERSRADFEKVEAACRDGGTSFHAAGIHPGFAGDLLPLTLARIASRVDAVHVYEVVIALTELEGYIEMFGFGSPVEGFAERPNPLDHGAPIFAQSMAMIVEGLGKKIEKVTTKVTVAPALKDIPNSDGVIKAGTVAAQHHEWTAWVDGKPLVVFHELYTMGDEFVEPGWALGRNRYRIVIEGDPPTELTLEGGAAADGRHVSHPGYTWTAMAGINVIPDVCDAKPGVHTILDLGVARPRGLVRPAS